MGKPKYFPKDLLALIPKMEERAAWVEESQLLEKMALNLKRSNFCLECLLKLSRVLRMAIQLALSTLARRVKSSTKKR